MTRSCARLQRGVLLHHARACTQRVSTDMRRFQEDNEAHGHTSSDSRVRLVDWCRPKVIFIEVGLLSASDQGLAKTLLEDSGYTAFRCGYGMEMLAVRKDE
eukprot:3645125-Rhodomonas_salina.2